MHDLSQKLKVMGDVKAYNNLAFSLYVFCFLYDNKVTDD